VAVPWAEKYARFSRLFERLAIDVMQECSIRGACELLRISWDEADGIKQRAVQRGLARKQPVVMPRLCVDEKGMVRGHNYLTIVARAKRGGRRWSMNWRAHASFRGEIIRPRPTHG
jgi:transposase